MWAVLNVCLYVDSAGDAFLYCTGCDKANSISKKEGKAERASLWAARGGRGWERKGGMLLFMHANNIVKRMLA